MSATDRDEMYRRQARSVLGDAMFEHCRKVALDAPPPTPQQLAAIGRIFGPGMRRLTQSEDVAVPIAA